MRVQLSYPFMTTGKTIALTRQTFVDKVMSLLFNKLSSVQFSLVTQSCPTLSDPMDSILKSRDITLSTEVHLVKAMVFPVVMYGCEIWTVRKA